MVVWNVWRTEWRCNVFWKYIWDLAGEEKMLQKTYKNNLSIIFLLSSEFLLNYGVISVSNP